MMVERGLWSYSIFVSRKGQQAGCSGVLLLVWLTDGQGRMAAAIAASVRIMELVLL